MLSYVYQVQQRTRTGYKPVYLYPDPKPLEFTDLDEAIYKARFCASKCDNIRVVKIETYLIESFEK